LMHPVRSGAPPAAAAAAAAVARRDHGLFYAGGALIGAFALAVVVIVAAVAVTVAFSKSKSKSSTSSSTSSSTTSTTTSTSTSTARPPGVGGEGSLFPGVGVSSVPSPIPVFTPVVPNPTIQSVLPCPTGTRLERDVATGWLYCALPKGGLEGPSLRFHKNGKLRTQETYAREKKTGREWTFDETGKLALVEDMSEGKADGLRIEVHSNGRTRTEHPYRRGVEHGLWRRWDKDGNLESWLRYDNGKIVDTSK
jgi:hypothetical protein